MPGRIARDRGFDLDDVAPMSPSSMQQNGPAMTCEMSSTLMPANGSVAIFLLPYAPYGGADFPVQIILYMI